MAKDEAKVETKKQKPTEYVILRRNEDGAWAESGKASAANGTDAIKKQTKLADGSNEAGDYRAVPAASWESKSNKLRIATKQVMQTLFSDPDEAETAEGEKVEEPPLRVAS